MKISKKEENYLIEEIKQLFELQCKVNNDKTTIYLSHYINDNVSVISICPHWTFDFTLFTSSLLEHFLPYGFPYKHYYRVEEDRSKNFAYSIDIVLLNQAEIQHCIKEIQMQQNDKTIPKCEWFSFPIQYVQYGYKPSEIPTILGMLERCQVVSVIDPQPPLLK